MLFYAYFSVLKERNSRRSETERNQLEKLFLEGKHRGNLECMSGETRATHEGGGSTHPPRARPLPRGAPVAPPTFSLHPYIPTYAKTSRTEDRSGVPLQQASIATKNLSGARSGTLPEGGSFPVAIFIIPATTTMRRE